MTTISPSASSGEHAARSFAARRHGAFIDGRFEVLDGADHWIPEHAADTLNRLLLQHLAMGDS